MTTKREREQLDAQTVVHIVKGRGRKAHRAQCTVGELAYWEERGYRTYKPQIPQLD